METARRWLDTVEPFALPLVKLVGPLLLRYFAVWYLRRRKQRALTKRQYLLIWSAVLAARHEIRRRRQRLNAPIASALIGE
jgi:hypothetical protein